MILRTEIRRRLIAAVEREGMTLDRERMAIPVVNALVPEVLKIIAEEVKKAGKEKHVTRDP